MLSGQKLHGLRAIYNAVDSDCDCIAAACINSCLIEASDEASNLGGRCCKQLTCCAIAKDYGCVVFDLIESFASNGKSITTKLIQTCVGRD